MAIHCPEISEGKMSPRAAFIAGFEHTANDRKLFEARAFWLSSSAIQNLIREGRLSEAVPILRGMRRSAKFLTADHLLGRRMQASAQELFALLVDTRMDMAGDLAGTGQ
jgi:hypothetical protein